MYLRSILRKRTYCILVGETTYATSLNATQLNWSFKYYRAKLWNDLNNEMKAAVSLKDFKVLISEWPGPISINVLCVRCVISQERSFMQFYVTCYN